MTILRALNRLTWRFTPQDDEKKPRKFQPNENDVAALNTIIDHVNNAREQAVKNNAAFAKMYIMTYTYFLDHFGSKAADGTRIPADIFDEIPQKQLHRQLDLPLDYFYQRFTDRLNESRAYEVVDQVERGDKRIEELEQEEIETLTEQTWDVETVTRNLNSMIAEAIIKFNK